eukprot:XP_011677364.1 PREDICTED: uncharacterized protein LOC100893946 [Strongylocentrotus purpuratus]
MMEGSRDGCGHVCNENVSMSFSHNIEELIGGEGDPTGETSTEQRGDSSMDCEPLDGEGWVGDITMPSGEEIPSPEISHGLSHDPEGERLSLLSQNLYAEVGNGHSHVGATDTVPVESHQHGTHTYEGGSHAEELHVSPDMSHDQSYVRGTGEGRESLTLTLLMQRNQK